MREVVQAKEQSQSKTEHGDWAEWSSNQIRICAKWNQDVYLFVCLLNFYSHPISVDDLGLLTTTKILQLRH